VIYVNPKVADTFGSRLNPHLDPVELFSTITFDTFESIQEKRNIASILSE